MKRRLFLLLFAALAIGCGHKTDAQTPASSAAHAPGLPVFDQKRAFADLEAQCAFGPRVPGTAAHKNCEEFIQKSLTGNVDRIATQDFVWNDHAKRKAIPMSNIFGVINPGGAKKIMLCAHWDSRPIAEQDFTPSNRRKPIPGADDGASGVAVLLELARYFHAASPKACIILAFWDGEDWGPGDDNMYIGASYFAKHPMDLKPDQAILIDMIGQKGLAITVERTSYEKCPDLVKKVWDTAASLGYSAQFPFSIKYRMSDDHVPLLNAGIPCIDLIDFDYAYWHTLDDTPDKCAPESLAAVGNTLAAVALSK